MRHRLPLALALALTLGACQGLPPEAPFLGLASLSLAPSGSLELQLTTPRQLLGLADLHRIHLRLTRDGLTLAERTVEAAGLQANQGRVTFQALSLGAISVEARALDAQGQLLGLASASGLIQAGQALRLPLQLLVGAPAAAGQLGVDLSLVENEASGGAKPLRLSRILKRPAFPPGAYTLPTKAYLSPLLSNAIIHPATGAMWVAANHYLLRYPANLQGPAQACFLGEVALTLAPHSSGGVVVGDGDGGLWQVSDDCRASSTIAPNPGGSATGRTGRCPVGHQLDGQDRPVLWESMGEISGPAWNFSWPKPGAWNLTSSFGRLPPELYGAPAFSDPRPWCPGPRPNSFWALVSNPSHTSLALWDLRGNARITSTSSPAFPTETIDYSEESAKEENQTKEGMLPVNPENIISDGKGGFFLCASSRKSILSGHYPALSIWHGGEGLPLIRVWGPFLDPSERVLTETSFLGVPPYEGREAHLMLPEGTQMLQQFTRFASTGGGKGKVVLMDFSSIRILEEVSP